MSEHDLSKEFFAAYHAAVFEALGPKAPGFNARLGVILAGRWLDSLDSAPSESGEFKEALEEYFKGPFEFADTAEMSFSEGGASLYVNGCDICPGNELLRSSGGQGYCPISQMLKSAMARAMKKNVELTGSEKPGPVGECRLNYKLGD